MSEQTFPASREAAMSTSSIDYQALREEVVADTAASPEAAERYGAREITKIAFESFRFSQGDVGLQDRILDYVISHSNGDVDADKLHDAFAQVQKRASDFVGNAVVHSQQSVSPDNVATQVTEFQKKLKNIDESPLVSDSPMLAHMNPFDHLMMGFISVDHKWVVEKGGRPRNDQTEGDRSKPNSKHVSQLMSYGIMHRPTGIKEYDMMFEEITSRIASLWDLPGFQTRVGAEIKELATEHFSHYPGDKEAVPAEWRQRFGI